MAGGKKLFHTVVVVGASLGCGGIARDPGGLRDADREADTDGSPPPRGEAGAADTGACGVGTQLVCPDAGGCRCAPSPPQSVCDCGRLGEFRCRSCAIGDPPVDGRCLSGDGNGGPGDCFCDTSVVVAAPSDCPHSEQFTCTSFFGPEKYAACSCDVSAPLSQTDCASTTRLECQVGTECSALGASEGGVLGIVDPNESPRFACYCGAPPVPIL